MIGNLSEHIKRSFDRLSSDDYSINNVWKNKAYDWPGDWEGRALLAFVCLYEIIGKKISCMDEMIKEFPTRVNGGGYLGDSANGVANEQQLSGHSWLLRGFCEYYRVFNDDRVLSYARDIVKNLYLPLKDLYNKYPTDRAEENLGGVGGSISREENGWKLSTDIGCAYMCVDGLSDYYSITGEAETREMLDSLINGFMRLDRLKMKCQTHATLSAVRGIIRLYKSTGEKKYLDYAVSVFGLYIKHGMTLTYENFNWFGREDSWTEPCAVTDSFIVAATLFDITGDEKYKTLLSRIWFNGLNFCHRANGGAGPNTCVTAEQPYLNISMYEATFCCTMRYAEGLKFAKKYEDYITTSQDITEDGQGRVFIGNELLVADECGSFPSAEKYYYKGKEYIKIPCFAQKGEYKLKVC